MHDVSKAKAASRLKTRRPPVERGRQIIFFAGKIHALGWRDEMIGFGSRTAPSRFVATDETTAFDPSYVIDCGKFFYGGPFWTNLGPGNLDDAAFELEQIRRRRIFEVNFERLRRADLTLVYFDDLGCYGTLGEIGWAQALGKKFVVGFGLGFHVDSLARDDLWTANQRACAVYHGGPREVRRAFCRDILNDWQVRDFLEEEEQDNDYHQEHHSERIQARDVGPDDPAPRGDAGHERERGCGHSAKRHCPSRPPCLEDPGRSKQLKRNKTEKNR